MDQVAIPIENNQLVSILEMIKLGKVPQSHIRIKLGNKPYRLIFRDANNMIKDWLSMLDMTVKDDIKFAFQIQKQKHEGRIQIFVGLNPNYDIVNKNDRTYLIVHLKNGINP